MQRIAVIGNAGSGKSVFSEKLHSITGLPVYHLDKYFWKPHWTRPDDHEYKKVHDSLCDKEHWIIDGLNLRHLEYRIEKADTIVFLDFPLRVCLWRIFKRMFFYYGKPTPYSAQDCPERFNKEFLQFLAWVWNFKKKYPTRIKELLDNQIVHKNVYIFKSQAEADAFLDALSKQ